MILFILQYYSFALIYSLFSISANTCPLLRSLSISCSFRFICSSQFFKSRNSFCKSSELSRTCFCINIELSSSMINRISQIDNSVSYCDLLRQCWLMSITIFSYCSHWLINRICIPEKLSLYFKII